MAPVISRVFSLTIWLKFKLTIISKSPTVATAIWRASVSEPFGKAPSVTYFSARTFAYSLKLRTLTPYFPIRLNMYSRFGSGAASNSAST